MAKSAEDLLNAMPSGEDLLASLAQEVGIDLNTPVDEIKSEKPKKEPQKKEEKPKFAPKQKSTTKKTESKVKEEVASGEDNGKPSELPTKTDKPKSNNKPTSTTKKSTAKKSTEKVDDKVPKSDRKTIFGEWRGYKVNYMGKPMSEEGKFITLSKRYDTKTQEKFRDVNGRMVMVVEKNKEGKVQAVRVYAEDIKGTRDELKTQGTMVNPNRMENRCRVYAGLLELAYDRKKDIEEVAV
jgi:outer membrane biosynthesis protein TonB